MIHLSFKEIVYLLKWIGFFDPYTQKKIMYMFYEKILHEILYYTYIVNTYTHNLKKPRISLEFHHVFTGLLAFSMFLFSSKVSTKRFTLM